MFNKKIQAHCNAIKSLKKNDEKNKIYIRQNKQ